MKYYADKNYAPVSDLLIQASIKTENQLMAFFDLVGKIFQTLAEVQDHTLYFIKVVQLTMEHLFHYHLMNQVKKVSTIYHALQEWI